MLPAADSKESIRHLHRQQREAKLQAAREFVADSWTVMQDHMANGSDVVPERIAPCLELVDAETWQSSLFRLASLSWSIPVSHGYGRRMRFLVWDASNSKLMGILALGDPVFNLAARDQHIGWSSAQRKKRLVGIMDAYVLGAVPPYSSLLCGKLIACLASSREVVAAFAKKYGGSRGIISRRKKRAALAVVTTTSALGRSAIYNRLVLDGRSYLKSVGYTSGWGHFHVPDDLFVQMRAYLTRRRHAYSANHQFGDGPNWKLRAVRETLSLIGMDPDLLRHGVGREVFVGEVAKNALAYLKGHDGDCDHTGLLTASRIGEAALQRWILGRARRNPEYSLWKKEDLLSRLIPEGEGERDKVRGDVASKLQYRRA